MKLVLLFLILVNAIFFGWSRWVDVAPAGVVVATPEPEAEALVLYAEKFPPEPEQTEPVATLDALVAEVTPDEAPEDTTGEPADLGAADSVAEIPEAEPTTQATPAVVAVVQAPEPEPPAATVAEAPEPVAEEPASQVAALVTDGGPDTARCMSIGPFRELSVAGPVAATLRASGLTPRAREEEAQLWVGHWVHLPPAASRAAAVEVVEKLRNDGVSDIYIESSGPMRHAISLGLFSDVSRAETRAGKVRQLGVRPQIRDRYRDGTQHWIDLELAPGQQLDAAQFESLPDANAALTERPCSTDQGTG